MEKSEQLSFKEKFLNAISGGEYQKQLNQHTEAVNKLKEATDLFLERAQEDIMWTRTSALDLSLNSRPRLDVIRDSRWEFVYSAFIRRSVWCHTEFAVGQGITLRERRKAGVGSNPDYEIIKNIWNDARNQESVFCMDRQQECSNGLLTDGELFYSIHVNPDNPKDIQIRRYPTLCVTNIIDHPDDSGLVLYFVTEQTDKTLDVMQGRYVENFDSIRKVKYVRSLGNTMPENDPLFDSIPEDMIEPNTYMLHIARNRIPGQGFGVPDTTPAIRWDRAWKRLAEDQSTISRATAALMATLTLEGDQSVMQNLQTTLQSVTTTGGPISPLAGGMTFLPETSHLKVDKADTKARDAMENSRMLRQPIAAAFGLALHYNTADGENSNLATTTSMELPILKHLLCYQGQLLEGYRKIFDFVLRYNEIDPESVIFVLGGPDIINPDERGPAMILATAIDSRSLTPEQAAQKSLEMLQFNDVTEELDSWKEWIEVQPKNNNPIPVADPANSLSNPGQLSNSEQSNKKTDEQGNQIASYNQGNDYSGSDPQNSQYYVNKH